MAEAGWASLLLATMYNGPHHPLVQLPWLALALPATAAVVVSAWGRQLVGPWWRARPWTEVRKAPLGSQAAVPPGSRIGVPLRRRFGLGHARWRPTWWRSELVPLAPLLVVGIAVTAGLISELTIGGSFARVAIRPTTTVGHHAAVVAGAGWLVSILCWVRGFWLGRSQLSPRHVLLSLALAGAVFLGIFAGRAADPSPQFERATGAAGWLFFVSFPLTAAVIALVHQRDLERQVLDRTSSRPSGVWVAVLALPLASVALVSLLVAAVIGPAAPALGHAVTFTVSNIADGLRAAAVWIWHLLPIGHAKAKLPTQPGLHLPTGRGKRLEVPKHGGGHLPAVVGELLVIVVVLVAGIFLVRRLRLPSGWRPVGEPGGTESGSLFSWRHLFDQIRGALARILDPSRLDLRRLRPRRVVATGPQAADDARAEGSVPSTVREIYRSVLVACREVGSARQQAETGRELEGRLSRRLTLDPDAYLRLQHLTRLYEGVRYGSAADAEAEPAAADAGVVIPALWAAHPEAAHPEAARAETVRAEAAEVGVGAADPGRASLGDETGGSA